jgi:hypothetical protein
LTAWAACVASPARGEQCHDSGRDIQGLHGATESCAWEINIKEHANNEGVALHLPTNENGTPRGAVFYS